MLEVTGVQAVEVMVRSDGKVLWVNTQEGCILRICQMEKLTIVDQRREGPNEKNLAARGLVGFRTPVKGGVNPMSMAREDRARRVINRYKVLTKNVLNEVILGLICDEIREAEESIQQRATDSEEAQDPASRDVEGETE